MGTHEAIIPGSFRSAKSCAQFMHDNFVCNFMVILRSEISVSAIEPDVFAFPTADTCVLAVGGCADFESARSTSGLAEGQP